MEKEDNKDQPLETEISSESLSGLEDNSPGQFIEPYKEIEDPAEGRLGSLAQIERDRFQELLLIAVRR